MINGGNNGPLCIDEINEKRSDEDTFHDTKETFASRFGPRVFVATILVYGNADGVSDAEYRVCHSCNDYLEDPVGCLKD
jgi:hypothetical protein